MTDLSCLLRTTQQTQHAHRALQALQQAWLTVDQQQLSVEPFLVQRSLVIVQQLQQLPFQTEIGTSLQQLAQHIRTQQQLQPMKARFTDTNGGHFFFFRNTNNSIGYFVAFNTNYFCT